jgi:hypothetical protein
MTLRAQTMKEDIDELNLIKIENLCASKDTIAKDPQYGRKY